MKAEFLIACALFAASCQTTLTGPERPIPMDEHSYAQPNRVRVTHLDLDLALDFAEKEARGTATLTLDRKDPAAPLVLDSMALLIEAVKGADGADRPFSLGPDREGFGQPLSIELEPGDATVAIRYRTTRGAEALQWLAPEQTAGGRHPFLFTQGQAILTRTWIPLQDSPGVRVSYTARVRAPEPLTVVMSAEQLGRDDEGAYRFRLDQPIPSYLIALSCGELESRPVSKRCAVWAEPSVVDAARDEFEDTEAMIQSAEGLFGPYRWGRYDMIILPPSFPYGGMENPLLTFVTPTVLAGDKSLVSLIAHELAHSWSGNLVTNATWRDFWLNEGFTVYFEKRIMEEVFGLERANMEKLLDREDLVREIDESEPWKSVLHVDLTGRHPDDGFSTIPYEKGALFLRRLEEVFGRERLDELLTAWFDEHAFQSVTTPDFEAFLSERLFASDSSKAAQIDLDVWLRGSGLPDDAPRVESDAIVLVERELERFAAGAGAGDLTVTAWVTQQWLHFLENLPDELDAERMGDLDRTFGFTETGNNEILCVWLKLSIRHGYGPASERLERFLMTVGRRKFLSPLYKELVKSDAGRAKAREIYARARPRYHAVSTGSLDKIVGAK